MYEVQKSTEHALKYAHIATTLTQYVVSSSFILRLTLVYRTLRKELIVP